MTNYEMIIALPVEEMAFSIMCPNEIGMAEIECDKSDDKDCFQCCLNWLKEEAK